MGNKGLALQDKITALRDANDPSSLEYKFLSRIDLSKTSLVWLAINSLLLISAIGIGWPVLYPQEDSSMLIPEENQSLDARLQQLMDEASEANQRFDAEMARIQALTQDAIATCDELLDEWDDGSVEYCFQKADSIG